MRLKNIIVAAIVVAVLIGIKFIFFPNKAGKQAVNAKGGFKPSNVTGYVVKPQRISNQISASGTILANEEVQLQPELSGKIVQINFKEGSKVSKGQLLVKINDTDLQAQYKKLQYQFQLAEQTLQRQKQLLEINGISQQEFDIAQNAYNTVKADMDFAMAQLVKTEIKAPFDGIVGLKNVSEGAYVTPATVIAGIQQIDPVKIDFSVPERYVTYLKKDAEVVFSIDGLQKQLKGKIYAIEPKIDMTTRTVQVRAICPNANADVLPGAFAQIMVALSDIDNAVMIPTEAIIPDISGQKVYIVKNNKSTYVRVQTGVRTVATIQIVNGLNAGDTVLTTGIMQLKPDSPVNITELK